MSHRSIGISNGLTAITRKPERSEPDQQLMEFSNEPAIFQTWSRICRSANTVYADPAGGSSRIRRTCARCFERSGSRTKARNASITAIGQEYQCPSLQFQAIASAASSRRVTISSGSKAIGAHTRLKLAVSRHTRAPKCPTPEYFDAVKS